MDDVSLEILKIVGDIKEEMGGIKSDVRATYEQACKTNGRVNKLEKETIPVLSGRVDKIESKNDTAAGQKSVLLSIGRSGFEITKLAIAAGLGALMGGHK